MKRFYTYIATNKRNTVLYTGSTSDLKRRILEHSKKRGTEFTSKYNVNKLVWYQGFSSREESVALEKKIKGWNRAKKIEMIKSSNPKFSDLLFRPQL